MDQEVKSIALQDLVLWTENPRDPIDPKATDQDIADRALTSSTQKWSLHKLAKVMGEYYDLSELPTVVYHGKTPVVYDGNRRMLLGKIKFGLVSIDKGVNLQLPEFPEHIPCNVCTKKIALNNVLRKHGDSGSWEPLERDIFLHKHMGEPKSPFLILEEDTGLISANPHLNQGFVKKEVFNSTMLQNLGFTISKGRLNSIHRDEEAYAILNDISEKVGNRILSTRGEYRGKVVEALESQHQRLIEENKNNKSRRSKISFRPSQSGEQSQQRQARRTTSDKNLAFGGKLYLKPGDVANLHRDIDDLFKFYESQKDKLSHSFPNLLGMSLRLLCETAALKDHNRSLESYVTKYFSEAKKTLDQDTKNSLGVYVINEKSIIQHLHTFAHSYSAAKNVPHIITLSHIIGAMLTLSHGK